MSSIRERFNDWNEDTVIIRPAKVGKGGEGSGEKEGHPFRGNQYTDTAASGEVGSAPGEGIISYYHGTVADLKDEILREGIVPGGNYSRVWSSEHYEGERGESVFMAISEEAAVDWGESAGRGTIPTVVVFEVEPPPDAEIKDDEEVETAVRVVGTVPPSWIKSYTVYEPESNYAYADLVPKEHVELRKMRGSGRYYVPIVVMDENAMTRVSKGGAGSGEPEGHPFRGNQYTDGMTGQAGEHPSRPGYLDPNKPVPRRFTEEWFRQRMQERIALAERGELPKLLISEGQTRPSNEELASMTKEELEAAWSRFRAAATEFRNIGDITEWNRHYNYGRYYFRRLQELNGQNTPSVTAAEPESRIGVIDRSLTATWDQLIAQGRLSTYASSNLARVREKWDEYTEGLDPGVYFNNIFKDSGLKYEITNIRVGSGGRTISYSLNMHDQDGNYVGDQSRTLNFDDEVVSHDLMTFERSDQGGGLCRSITGNSLAMYKAMGFRKVHVGAGLEGGGYAWAKYGFIPLQSSWNVLRQSARTWADANIHNPNARRAFQRICDDENPKALWALADFNSHPEREQVKTDPTTWNEGKQYLRGRGWSGDIVISDPECVTRTLTYARSKPTMKKVA